MGRRASMDGRVTRILATSCRREEEPSDGGVEFEFLNDGEVVVNSSSSSSDECLSNELELLDDDVEEREDDASVEENRSFWENQHQLLQNIICRTSSTETGIRNATKEALKEIQRAEILCSCGRETALSCCRKCLIREVSRRLQSHGYNSAICRTKWRTSVDIPAGDHEFVDVIESSKKGEMRVIVELNFRAEFEMARGSEDYNRLVRRLPEVFVGKAERLSNVIKVMCVAAKKCMKQKKMHMGPWRKHKYMQGKWLGPCERNTSWSSSFSMWDSGNNNQSMPKPKPKPKASLLTVDLLEKMPSMHCKAVAVL